MKTLSVAEAARNFDEVLDAIESSQEEIALVRDNREIARIIPEPMKQDAPAFFGDLHGRLDDDAADALSRAISTFRDSPHGRLSELQNPWVS